VVRMRTRLAALMGGPESNKALSLARDSRDVDLVLSVAAGFRRAGELEKALALLDRAVDLAPSAPVVWLNRGAVQQDLGKLGEAAMDYEQAAKLDPKQALAPFNLAVVCEARGQYVQALGRYAQVLEIDPAHALALNNVGALYLRVGQPVKAADYFRRARDLGTEFYAARLNLAKAYLAQDLRGQALDELKTYESEVPKEKRDPEAARLIGAIEGRSSAPKN